MRGAAIFGTALLVGCGGWDAGPTETDGVTPAQLEPLCPAPQGPPAFETRHPVSLHTAGNRIVDRDGNVGSPYSLITDYATGTPNDGYARAFYDHLQTKR